MEKRVEHKMRKLGRRLLLFPLPFEGHVTPMLHLANLLHSKGFSITLIQSHYKSLNPINFPHFTFYFINDGFSSSSSSTRSPFSLLSDLNTNCSEPFRDCLSTTLSEAHGHAKGQDQDQDEPIACLISDPLWLFAGAVANAFNLSRITLRTGSMSAYLVFHSIPILKEKGYYPLQETKLEETVSELPPLKVKDLPSEQSHDFLAALVRETRTSKGLICNSFEDLEASSVPQVQTSLPIPIFLIGPLHSITQSPASSGESCISWLDTQAPNSVLYVSFGSIATMTKPEFLEVAMGLANSMQPFLWVVRSELVHGQDPNEGFEEGFLDSVGGRGYILEWAPQKEVLAHRAVGGFWTHCGWNSTLESISEGVPMICLPFFADQEINRRYVSDEWRIGLGLESGVKMKREDVVKAITRLMVEEEGQEMRSRARSFQELAKLSHVKRGSSHKSLESLIHYLLSM